MINKKRFIIISVICLVLLLVILGIYLIKKSNVNEFKKAISSNNLEVIVLGRNNCHWCNEFSPVLKEVKEEYKLNYVYVKVDTLLSSDYKYVLETLKIDSLGTPTTFIVKSGKVMDKLIGYVDKQTFINFLRTNEIIKELDI